MSCHLQHPIIEALWLFQMQSLNCLTTLERTLVFQRWSFTVKCWICTSLMFAWVVGYKWEKWTRWGYVSWAMGRGLAMSTLIPCYVYQCDAFASFFEFILPLWFLTDRGDNTWVFSVEGWLPAVGGHLGHRCWCAHVRGGYTALTVWEGRCGGHVDLTPTHTSSGQEDCGRRPAGYLP